MSILFYQHFYLKSIKNLWLIEPSLYKNLDIYKDENEKKISIYPYYCVVLTETHCFILKQIYIKRLFPILDHAKRNVTSKLLMNWLETNRKEPEFDMISLA